MISATQFIYYFYIINNFDKAIINAKLLHMHYDDFLTKDFKIKKTHSLL